MPYSPDNPPDKLKGLSGKKQRQFMEVFNSCFDKHHDDGKCHAMAWGVVKKASDARMARIASRVAQEALREAGEARTGAEFEKGQFGL